MAKRGENIYKRKDGRWEGRYAKRIDGDGKRHYGYVYAKTYREVRQKLAEAKQQPFGQAEPHRFGDYCEAWLRLSRNRVKPSTYTKYHNIINKHILPQLGNFRPQGLSTVQLEAFSNRLLDKGLSPKTVRDILGVVSGVIRHCRRELGAALPPVDILYPKAEKQEMRVLTLAEQQTFVQYLLTDTDPAKFGVLLALLTGLRLGELCALKWDHIYMEERLLRVSATMQRLQIPELPGQTTVFVGNAKTDSSMRTIPLNDAAVILCQKKQVHDPNAYVLTGVADRFLEPRMVQYRLAKYTADCRLEGVHFHTLRHTFATRCVEVGFDIKSLSEILGHASPKVTLERYIHASLELKRTNMEKLAAVGL